MKTLSLRTFLLLGTALALVACDDSSEKSSQDEVTNTKADGAPNYILTAQSDSPTPTIAGNFLIGEFAQRQSDWTTASDSFAKVLDAAPNSKDIEHRMMALDLGSGNFEKALITAKKITADNAKGDSATLAYLITSLADFKAGKYQDTLKNIEGYKNDGLGLAVLPILRAWSDAGLGKTHISELESAPSLMYQAVLIASHTKDKETLSQLAKKYDFTHSPTPLDRLDDIAAIYAAHGEKDEAISIYSALKTAYQSDSKTDYAAKIKALESDGASFPLPKSAESPQTALSEALFDMARLLSNGYQDSAQLFAQMALYLTPNHAGSLELLAQIASSNGLYSKAINFLARIDTHTNKDQRIRIDRQVAELTNLSGDTDEAVRILKNIVSDAKNIPAQIQIGDLYRNKERYKESLSAYDKAFDMLDNKITADYWDLSFARGMVNERLQNWDQAEKDLKTALLFQPDQPYVLNYLGYSWADQGLYLDKAAEMLEKAVRLKPDDGAIVDSLGWVYFRTAQFDKAVTMLEQAVALDPTESEINDHLGDAYWRVGRKSEAIYQWKRAANFTKDDDIATTIRTKIDVGLPELPSKTTAEKIITNEK